MKTLIVNTFDTQGGAARAAYRLHQSLLSQNIDSQMLVQFKESDDSRVNTVFDKRIRKIFGHLRYLADGLLVRFYCHKTKTLFSPAWLSFGGVIAKINEINPDIVHLHWICAGMMSVEDIAKIKAPIVWSLHDMWAFTGGCHYSGDCKLYKETCNTCPVLKSKNENDLSQKIFERKKKAFAETDNITIVGLSKWLSDCAVQSDLLKDKKHINLPNPINTSKFSKKNKLKSRKTLSLPKDRKLILFGAMDAMDDINKGFPRLSSALRKIHNKDTELVVFGGNKNEESADLFDFKTHYIGHITDDVKMTELYSAADVMIVPSVQENLSNVIMESLSCSTPVVGFDIGGNSDMIDHKKNGYLAKPFDTQDLARGIEWVLYNETYEQLCKNAQEKVVTTFDSKVVAKKYIELYKNILSKK